MLLLSRSPFALEQFADVGVKLFAVATRSYSAGILPAVSTYGVRAGTGGRSSVSGITATVFGANGFIGSYVVNELARRGCQVVVPYRCPDEKAIHCKQMGDLGQVVLMENFSILNEEQVKQAISRSNVVVNLIGRRMESMQYTYEDSHTEWPKRLAKIVAASPQVERFIHFSDIGADEKSLSRRMKSKALGDKAVREILPSATIIKPAPVVGDEDYFFNVYTYFVKSAPAIFLPDDGVAKMQPTYVVDVAQSVMQILKDPESVGKDYYLGGPEVLTLREIYHLLTKVVRKDVDESYAVPKWLLKALYARKDFGRRLIPNMSGGSFIKSADYVEEMCADKVVPAGVAGYADLGIQPRSVTEGLPIEHVRHARSGGYGHGDLEPVSKNLPQHFKKLYDTLVRGRMMNI